MKKLILFWILIFSLQIFAQDKAVALKFDEFDDAVEEYLFAEPISITQRIERFANQLKKTSNSKAYIIYYQSQISENSYAASNLAHSIKSILSYRKGIDSEKIVLIDGEQLAQLMIDHNLEVTTEITYEIKKIDSDYFDGE